MYVCSNKYVFNPIKNTLVYCSIKLKDNWVKVFKNGPSKIFC